MQWIELHGDRGGFDDPAMVCGIGSMDGMSFMFIGQQKGRNTKENIHRNFAMPMPNGYTYVQPLPVYYKGCVRVLGDSIPLRTYFKASEMWKLLQRAVLFANS